MDGLWQLSAAMYANHATKIPHQKRAEQHLFFIGSYDTNSIVANRKGKDSATQLLHLHNFHWECWKHREQIYIYLLSISRRKKLILKKHYEDLKLKAAKNRYRCRGRVDQEEYGIRYGVDNKLLQSTAVMMMLYNALILHYMYALSLSSTTSYNKYDLSSADTLSSSSLPLPLPFMCFFLSLLPTSYIYIDIALVSLV